MSNSDYYLNHMNPWNEAGYYYVCIEYIYAKARPAPQAKIRILKPSQTSLYDPDNSAFLLLKVVNVIFNGTTFEIDSLTDYDPSNTSNRRVFSQLYSGAEDTLPSFDNIRDEGRLIYVKDKDELYFGTESRWESFTAIRGHVNTSNCSSGDIGYVDENGDVQLAIATSEVTLADCIVLNGDDQCRLYGETTDVSIESGVTISKGDSLYLSSIEPGKITNLKPLRFIQFIGIAISDGNLNKCDIWFLPSRSGINTIDVYDFYQDLLHNSIFEYLFIETFENNDFFDMSKTNIDIDVKDYSISGVTGDVYQSVSLQTSSYASQLVMAQVTAKEKCENMGSIQWYISNNGSDDDDWEIVELDKIHYFSSFKLLFSSTTGTFQLGENVLSSTTGKMATINGLNNGAMLVFGDTRYGAWYFIGETVTGQTSGATGMISVVVDRKQPSYHDLRIRFEMNGNVGDCQVYDYGVIYDQDEDIYNYDDLDTQSNIDTLYLDLYENPHQDNDGFRNLSVPLETQINNLELFVNDLDQTCSTSITQIENDIQNIYNNEITNITNNITNIEYQLDVIDTTAINSIVTYTDDDVDTLYQDIYTSPSRDGDGVANLSIPLETRITNLESSSGGGSSVLGPALFITTADSTPDVSSNPSIIRVDYAASLVITNFLNGTIGQQLIIIFTNSNTTVEFNANITLYDSNNFVASDEYTLSLVSNGSKWVEFSRSENSGYVVATTPATDPNDYFTKTEVDSMFDNLTYGVGTTGSSVAPGAADWYTKTEFDSMIDNITYGGGTLGPIGGSGASEWYTKAQMNTIFANLTYA